MPPKGIVLPFERSPGETYNFRPLLLRTLQRHPPQYSARGRVRVSTHLTPAAPFASTRFCAASASPPDRYEPKSAEPDPESAAYTARPVCPGPKGQLDLWQGKDARRSRPFKSFSIRARDPGADKLDSFSPARSSLSARTPEEPATSAPPGIQFREGAQVGMARPL